MNEIKSMTACCGLNCTECDVFLATKNNDDDQRKRVAEKWSREFNWNLRLSDINCEGCKKENGQIFGFCNEYKVRACAKKSGIDNCAFCDEYACEKLQDIFSLDPAIKKNLDRIRSNVQ